MVGYTHETAMRSLILRAPRFSRRLAAVAGPAAGRDLTGNRTPARMAGQRPQTRLAAQGPGRWLRHPRRCRPADLSPQQPRARQRVRAGAGRSRGEVTLDYDAGKSRQSRHAAVLPQGALDADGG